MKAHEFFNSKAHTVLGLTTALQTIARNKTMQLSESLLINEALRWVGVKEQAANKGQLVELFQKAVDGRANAESWCMAFQQYCIQAVDAQLKIFAPQQKSSRIFRSEHCLTTWNNSPREHRMDKPEPGCLVVWKHGDTTNGHVGLVYEIDGDGYLKTIEGNTGAGPGVISNGDGVYKRVRDPKGTGEMKVVGFLKVWI